MPHYEITFIARQDVSQNDIDKLTEGFSEFINGNDGKVIKTENWGLLNLAYNIKKNRKGHYVMLGVEAPYSTVQEVERRMKLNEDIIKNVTIRVEEIDESPSPMMSNKNYDDSEVKQTTSNVEVEEHVGEE